MAFGDEQNSVCSNFPCSKSHVFTVPSYAHKLVIHNITSIASITQGYTILLAGENQVSEFIIYVCQYNSYQI